VDGEIIKSRLEKLDECIRLLEERQCFDYEKFISDLTLMDSVERRLEIACQIVKDIVISDILKAIFNENVSDNENAIVQLRGKNVLSDKLINNLIPTVNFRNRLVHEYLDYDPQVVFKVQHEHLDDLKDFVSEIIDYFGW
jgi:uncharacterized protein YutE (UPF0331/DUF86 family)